MSDEDDPQSLTPAALRAGVKLQPGESIKVTVIGVSGKPPSGSGRKPRPVDAPTGAATGTDASGADAPDTQVGGDGGGQTDATGEGSGAPAEGIDIEWSFVKHDGTPLDNQACTITAEDGTQVKGKLSSGVLKMKVPPGHLIVEVEGHVLGDVNRPAVEAA